MWPMPRLPHCQHHMGHHIGVWTSNIPNKSSALLPRSNGDSIKTFTVWMTETYRLQHRRDLCSSKGILTTELIPACRGRHPAVILYLKSCVSNSWVGTTEGNPKTETDSNACNLVIKAKPQRQERDGIQPGTGLLRLNSQESSSLPVASCRVQQLLLFRFNVGFIPCTLVLFH